MDTRLIKLTSAAQNYGNLNISSCGRQIFPEDIFDSSSKKSGVGSQITINAEGVPYPIFTDIPVERESNRPRWIFRKRSWVKDFVKINNLKVGDTIIIERVASRKYLVKPNGNHSDFVTLEDAAKITGKTIHNIRDYIQRGRIKKYNQFGERISKANNGELRVSIEEIEKFLNFIEKDRQRHHSKGQNEELGFYGLPEYERTKHVHRLHPYLGKFIPQLVEWFLSRYFKEDDIILDPFMGSRTTLVHSNDLKMYAILRDISELFSLLN